MSGRCLHRSWRVPLKSNSLRHSRHRPNSAPYSTTVSSLSSVVEYAQQLRLRDLESAITSEESPSHVWAEYAHLVGIAGGDYIPVGVHQQVLRLCCPSTTDLKTSVVRRLKDGILPSAADVPEARFHTIVQNIRSMGKMPALDDYNFILAQFAAVGHYQGCWDVYNELKRLRYTPNQATFGFCFQSIAHRFSLPIPKASRETTATITQDMFSTYMADMRESKIPMNPVTYDLSTRIIKETLDLEAFEDLMRWGYGVDLSNPDRVALEFSAPSVSGSDGTRLVPFPFTTNALNTTLDVLGRLGKISKMVQAFEVLTEPLPNANQHFFNTFDSGEDDDFGVPVDITSTPFPVPHATPNTSSYNILLRHICRADHATFARHYINQARMLDSQLSHLFRNEFHSRYSKRKPLEALPSPRFNMNAGMLIPCLGEGNRDKNLGLLKWLQSKIPSILKTCKQDLDLFTQVLRSLQEEGKYGEETPIQVHVQPTVLELDIDNPPAFDVPKPKPFDIGLHVSILRRNHSELDIVRQRVDFIVRRTSERLKERLGRRVWADKDVFLSDQNDRVKVSKEQWKEVVNFQPRVDLASYAGSRHPSSPNRQTLIRRPTSPYTPAAQSYPASSPIPKGR